ncbi:MAG: Ser/Thr protein kinase RdoA (MazF antagonist) [Candidatus Promineifilaceae bacterium]|jgi:Ser/Thr protein kinase RdoA (MazF antagonist)
MEDAPQSDFQDLTPDVMLNAVEQALGVRLNGMATPLPSYINRVYDLQACDDKRYVAKFYRPGRWTRAALQDELDFVADCAADEIPVVPPIVGAGGDTLHVFDGIYFAVYPRRLGRQLEINSLDDWTRVGRLIGRVHVAGSRREAASRTDLHPGATISDHVDHLLDGGFLAGRHAEDFDDIAHTILDRIHDAFDDVEFIRIHGDCHCGNLLDRMDEGLAIIDFDDMMMGPPVQDMWLLLPGRLADCRREWSAMLKGYEQFREFDDQSAQLVEPLRAMRIIYFLAWCSHQVHDYRFQTMYPDWGSDDFWQREVNDLRTQLHHIEETLL